MGAGVLDYEPSTMNCELGGVKKGLTKRMALSRLTSNISLKV